MTCDLRIFIFLVLQNYSAHFEIQASTHQSNYCHICVSKVMSASFVCSLVCKFMHATLSPFAMSFLLFYSLPSPFCCSLSSPSLYAPYFLSSRTGSVKYQVDERKQQQGLWDFRQIFVNTWEGFCCSCMKHHSSYGSLNFQLHVDIVTQPLLFFHAPKPPIKLSVYF